MRQQQHLQPSISTPISFGQSCRYRLSILLTAITLSPVAIGPMSRFDAPGWGRGVLILFVRFFGRIAWTPASSRGSARWTLYRLPAPWV